MYDTAVGADGHIDAGLLEVFVPGCGNFDQSRCLTAADALGLAGDADGTAADADLDKVRAGLSQEPEAVLIDHVARADLDGVAVVLPYPCNGLGLPAGVALGGIDHQHVHTGLQQRGNTGRIVPGIDAGAHQIAFFAVQQFLRILLVGGVVLAEHEVHQVVIFIDDGQAVQLVVPDDVVGSLQRGILGSGDQLGAGGHKGGHLIVGVHAGNAVVPGGDDAQQLAGGCAVVGDGDGREAVARLQSQHVRQSGVRGQVGSGNHEARLVIFDLAHHLGLAFDGLGAENEADTALLGQRNGQRIIGNGLHDGGGQRNIQGDRRLLHALAVLDQRRFQGNTVRDAFFGSIAGDEQIFAEGVAGFRIIVRHGLIPPDDRYIYLYNNKWKGGTDYTAFSSA